MTGENPPRSRDALRAHCANALAALEGQNLLRRMREVDSAQGTEIVVGGRCLLNFSSNDYLGLANHPAIADAAHEAVARFGTGSGASRLVCGNLAPHAALENAIARLKGTGAALAFSSGYAAALGTIPALVGRGDAIILDKLCHACLVDAARLSGARVRVFRHNDMAQLEEHLRWAASSDMRALVLVESVYSMDGDAAPLRAIVEAKDRHGAWLLVDEAHATGIFGPGGAGLCRELGVSERVEIQMGTLSKAFGSSGGFIAGDRELIDLLINRARSFIFSTGPAPAAVAAARAAVELSSGPEGDVRRTALWANINDLATELQDLWPDPPKGESPILPLIVGAENSALAIAGALRERGLWIPAIRYPTVARAKARLRVSLSAAHTRAQVAALVEALRAVRGIK
ncbi:MAG TPA: 8-amino-7-oxononanoate synthase [Verrucomicrobiae bacterium]|nr:8-amino-7-oxononanoate synthase [Verrucomicrobiae bacterium]